MAQWFFNYSGEQTGPFEDVQAREQARRNANGYCWRQGFAEWQPIGQVEELRDSLATLPPAAVAAPPVVRNAGQRNADDIDYRIFGSDMQFVEIELDPGESAIAEAGSMMYKEADVKLDTVFGDGSQAGSSGGFMGKLLSAGKRVITGESLFTTMFTQNGSGKGKVAFAAPYPGTIVPMKLTDFGGRLICQKDSFLCAARGVSIGIFFQRKILTGLFGGEGFIMQKLEGDGLAFIHAGGTIVERQLAPGERLDVDTGCVVALTDSVGFDVKPVGGIKSMLFGGEGLFLATLTGPGKIWLQSLPFSRMAGRMLAGAKGGKEEGSVLGGLGDLLSGDRS
ncbi:TIGR00266 family protein [Tahibacter sp.]|uniref:TIGR00266 family protein n=1 Tax=Tahibacter sp. TaxID=2056211 RepID=UPI0028C507C6|nr:TIGR00266 family protein [Tahibacter sp.]